MNLKTILLGTLVVILILGLTSFCYLTYVLKYDTSNNGALVKTHQMLFYLQLVLHLLGFITSGLVVYKK